MSSPDPAGAGAPGRGGALHVLDPIIWRSPSGVRSMRHLLGYTGLPPAYAAAKTVCGLHVPTDRLIDQTNEEAAQTGQAGEEAALCSRCLAHVERRGRAFYAAQQERWTAIERRGRGGQSATS